MICTFDLFRKNRYAYRFKNLCLDDHELEIGDGATKIILNAKGRKGKASESLKALLSYINGRAAQDDFSRRLDEEVKKIKANTEWEADYVTWEMRMRDIKNDGKKEGIKAGMKAGLKKGRIEEKISVIRNMKEMNFPLESIEKIVGWSAEEIMAVI